MAKKLVCDRCGLEVTDRWDIYKIMEGRTAWEEAARARGAEARGVFPCKNYVRCGGELRFTENSKIASWYNRVTKQNNQQKAVNRLSQN